ncbi:hypothetical protein [Stenomitos frigidus]|uniref:Uncharacterized protein n=1 Tax=Stenomitos frigidus ULC18 TaxID=2107698 RepID=A0A2T1DUY8_9CYAN|nr:hypothetical protein [Stenomitos frigidus]PSB24194.1 hypothetical protein C7B82_27910 [Stenomitos frigidus ULC18]
MANEMDTMIAAANKYRGNEAMGFRGAEAAAQQPREVGDTETRAPFILGPVTFELHDLRVRGLGTVPAAPTNSPFIISEDEEYELSVNVEFNKTPLTELLMCLGTRIIIDYGLEGMGRKAAEVDVQATLVTQKGIFSYSLVHRGVARRDGLTPGLYEIGAVATIGPVENKCSTRIWGHGYIKEVLLEVYPSGQE